MHAVLAVPMGNISVTPRSFGRRGSIGENVACVVPGIISLATVFSSRPQLFAFLRIGNFVKLQLQGVLHTSDFAHRNSA